MIGVLAVAVALSVGASTVAASGASADATVTHDILRATAPIETPRAATRAATSWCGTASQADRAPNAIAGNPVHWVYLIPSDGPDELAAVASVMQSDAEEVDGWWRGQDPTRTPRNDLTAFSCGTQLDVTTVRSSRSGAQLAPLVGRFAALTNAVEQAGLASELTKYVVYYDGPSSDDNVCGQGGSDSTGFGVAIVYDRSCLGVSTAAVVAHELLHTFGAVATGAPHECTGDSAGHTCDNPQDLMYPAVGEDTLSTKVLDPGRDDYYGHSGGWIDTQDSAWLVRLDAQSPLALMLSGPGTVSADVPGLECAVSCTTTWNSGQRLALSATPSAGARFVRWAGACSGSAGCAVTVTPDAAVSALFAPASFRLTVAVSGEGTVRSARPGIVCRRKCSSTFTSYVPVRLAASPAKGWKLRSWSGACKGSRTTCTVPMSAATNARATFVRA